jgi:hypothetical protein
MPDDQVTLENVMDQLVIQDSPDRVVDKLHEFREVTGDFGTLLYAGVDWKDPALARQSMTLMAEKVAPLVGR